MIPQLLLQGAKAFLGRDLTPKGLQVARQLGTQLQNGFQQAQAQMAQQKPMQGPKKPSKEEIMGSDESTLDKLLSSFFPKASAEENPFEAALRAEEMIAPEEDNPFSQALLEETAGQAPSALRGFQSQASQGNQGVNMPSNGTQEQGSLLSRGFQQYLTDPSFLGRAQGLLKTSGGLIEKGFEKVVNPVVNPVFEKVVNPAVEKSQQALDYLSQPIQEALKAGLGEDGVKKAQEATGTIIDKGEAFYKGMTQSQKDTVNALFQIATTLPVGKLFKTSMKGGAGLISEEVSNTLKAGAAKKLERVLAPTKEVTKQATQKILPKLVEESPIALSRGSLLEKASSKVRDFGSQIDNFVEQNGVKGNISAKKVAEFFKEQKSQFIEPVSKAILEPGAVKVIDGLQDIVTEVFGDSKNVSNERMRALRQVWDRTVEKSKGFQKTLDQGTELGVKKNFTNFVRSEIAKANPSLDAINKEFSFWKGVEDVLGQTVKRTTGQSGGLTGEIMTSAGAILGTSVGGIAGGAGGALALRALNRIFDSTAYRTISAAWKSKLANALASGDVKILKNLLNSPELAGLGILGGKNKD